MVQWFVEHLVRSEADLQEPRLSLVDADLRGLAPVTVINARLDPLRSDGAKLEDALRDAGVSVERREYEGVAHEFFGAAAVMEKAKQAQAFAGGAVSGVLRQLSALAWPAWPTGEASPASRERFQPGQRGGRSAVR